jgi:hypothetical protein
MTLWFLRGLRRGVVTTSYPARPDDSASDLPTPPVFASGAIDRALADRLVVVCPSRALRREGGELRYDIGACTACGRCREIADQAIRPSGVFELAVTNRAHLIKRIPLKPEAGR